MQAIIARERMTGSMGSSWGGPSFVVEPDRARLREIAHRLRDGRLKSIVGAVRSLAEAPAASRPDRRSPEKTVIGLIADG
jgi:hypothetical protein